jgi:hypothetical protein
LVPRVRASGGELTWTEIGVPGRGWLVPQHSVDRAGRTEYHRPAKLRAPFGLVTVTVVAAGVDSLYLSFAGHVDENLVDVLEALKLEAQTEGAPAPFRAKDGRATVVHPTGSGHYRYWIHCSDFDVCVSRNGKLPPIYVKLASAYLHQVGPERALNVAEAFVRSALSAGLGPPAASRIDLYADFQGWVPTELDFRHFVTRARKSVQHFHDVRGHFDGRSFTGYQFGRDQMVARLYDKGREVVQSGKDAWMREVWGPRLDPELPIWRLEFQLRREAIASFNVGPAEEAVACRQDFWSYGITDWLSLRVPTLDQQRDRWPVSPEWHALERISIGVQENGLIRRRIREQEEEKLVAGATGYITSLAAIHDLCELDPALQLTGRKVIEHLARRGRNFKDAVAWKRQRSV